MPWKDKTKRNEYCKRYHAKNKTKQSKEYRLLSRYGIDKNEYDNLFMSQKGLCAICHNPDKVKLCLDHDHRTQKVRGLICAHCNNIVGQLETHPETVENAREYIRQHNTLQQRQVDLYAEG